MRSEWRGSSLKLRSDVCGGTCGFRLISELTVYESLGQAVQRCARQRYGTYVHVASSHYFVAVFVTEDCEHTGHAQPETCSG